MIQALPVKTTAGGRCVLLLFLLVISLSASCTKTQQPQAKHDEEALARTEFTARVENYFEYEPLKAGKQSQFLIHLTDLSDGTPVEKAEVTLVARTKNGGEVMQTKARIGKVTGIYVADISIPSSGDYDIEFHIKNGKLDERLPLSDFKVE